MPSVHPWSEAVFHYFYSRKSNRHLFPSSTQKTSNRSSIATVTYKRYLYVELLLTPFCQLNNLLRVLLYIATKRIYLSRIRPLSHLLYPKSQSSKQIHSFHPDDDDDGLFVYVYITTNHFISFAVIAADGADPRAHCHYNYHSRVVYPIAADIEIR